MPNYFNTILHFHPSFGSHSNRRFPKCYVMQVRRNIFFSSKKENEIFRLIRKTLWHDDNLIGATKMDRFIFWQILVWNGDFITLINAILDKTPESPSFPMDLYDELNGDIDQYRQGIECSMSSDDFLKLYELLNPESDTFFVVGR